MAVDDAHDVVALRKGHTSFKDAHDGLEIGQGGAGVGQVALDLVDVFYVGGVALVVVAHLLLKAGLYLGEFLVKAVLARLGKPQVLSVARKAPGRQRRARHDVCRVHDVENVVVQRVLAVGGRGDLRHGKTVAVDGSGVDVGVLVLVACAGLLPLLVVLVKVRAHQVGRGTAARVAADKQRHVVPAQVGLLFLDGFKVVNDGAHHVQAGIREALVVAFAQAVAVKDAAREAHAHVREPLGAVAAANRDHKKQLGLARLAVGDVLGGHGVGRGVGSIGGKDVGNLVDDLAAVAIRRGAGLFKAQFAQKVLHVVGHVVALLEVARLGVGHAGKHAGRLRQLVVVLRGILEEPLVVPGHRGAHGILAAYQALVVGRHREALAVVLRVDHLLKRGGGSDLCRANFCQVDAVAHQHGHRGHRQHNDGNNGN